ncbi:MAG TPA: ATP-binding protein [Longimicrobiales bacterium]|jgi:two-component system phosphate regulon sensor histidine kinase PhoR
MRVRLRVVFLAACLGSAALAIAAMHFGLAASASAAADGLRRTLALSAAVAFLGATILALALAGWFARVLHRLRSEFLRAPERPPSPHTPEPWVAELHALATAMRRLLEDLERRLASLARERDEIATLMRAVGEGIVQLAPGGRIVRLNPAARRLLGLPAAPEGQNVATLIRHGELRRLLERAASGEPVEASEITLDDRILFVTARPLETGTGTPPGALAVLVDLTALRRLEGVRRDFVANASHELKTPLTSIRGYAETLLSDDLPPELQRQFLETIHKNACRLQQIVDDLLDLSRLESGGWRPELQPLQVARIAEEAWGPFRERAAEKGVAFLVEPGDAVPARADPAGLRQIFSNLFDNALRHTPAGGRIAVHVGVSCDAGAVPGARAGRLGEPLAVGHGAALGHASHPAAPDPAGRWVVVEVRDTGSGIPRDALPRIFERFYRVDPARSRAEGGTGLGLSIVKHLVESMGGDVAAESELGKGTTIRFRLPAADAPVALHGV